MNKNDIIAMIKKEAEIAYQNRVDHQLEELRQIDKNNTQNADYEYIQRMIAHGIWTTLESMLAHIENMEGGK